MPAALVNGAPPQQTPITDARGRLTAPWFSYLCNLQNEAASTSAVSAIPNANAATTGLLKAADWSTFNNKQAALGFTPLNRASNLSDLLDAAAARTNLGLGSAATQSAAAFDPAGSWSSWVGDVDAASHNLSNVYILNTAGLQVTAFLAFSGSMYYQPGATTFFTGVNAGSGAWYEFAFFLQSGAAIANDELWFSVNSRSTLAGSDGYAPAIRIKALTGTVTFPNACTFAVAPAFSDAAGTRTALGLGTAATQNITAWTSYTPTLSTVNTMTIASQTLTSAEYQTTGPVTHIKLQFTVTFGGTANNVLNITLTAAVVGATSSIRASAYPGSGSYLVLPGLCITGGTTLTIYGPNAGNYTVGVAYTVYVTGFYRTT